MRPSNETEHETVIVDRRSSSSNRMHAVALAGSALLLWGVAALIGDPPDPPSRPLRLSVPSSDLPLAVAARIEVGTQPGSLMVGDDGIWVVVGEGLVRVDPAHNRVVQRIEGPGMFAYAFAADVEGELWIQQGGVTTDAPPAIVRLDPATSESTNVASYEGGPHGVAVGFGSVWAIDTGGVVTRIDASTGTVLARIPLDGPASGIDTGEGSVWVAGMSGVYRIDPASNAVVATVDLPFATDVSVGGEAVWVTAARPGAKGEGSQVVARIDPATNQPTIQTSVAGLTALTATADAVWAVTQVPAELVVIEPTTGAIRQRLVVGSMPLVDVAWADGAVWVAECCHGGQLLRIH